MTIEEILASAEQKKKANGKKSDIPFVQVSESIKTAVVRLRNVKKEIDNLDAEKQLLEAEILEEAIPARVQYMEENNRYTNSIKLEDSEGLSATVVWQHRYSKISIDQKANITDMLKESEADFGGEIKFARLFSQETEIKVKNTSEGVLTELIDLVGVENFSRFFEVERWITPKEDYTEEFHKLPNQETLAVVARQAKPAVKTK